MHPKPRKILVVSATENEMLGTQYLDVEQLVSGVGMVATTFALTKKLSEQKFDAVVNIGIAGSFQDIELGSVVQVVSDCLVELGVEDNDVFVPADEIEICKRGDLSFVTDLRLPAVREAVGVTVNRVHGSSRSIAEMVAQFNPDVESMEGAAVGFVCKQFDVPWVQLRAISNKVEPRNRAAWDIPLAIRNLHLETEKFLLSLDQ